MWSLPCSETPTPKSLRYSVLYRLSEDQSSENLCTSVLEQHLYVCDCVGLDEKQATVIYMFCLLTGARA